MRLRKAQFSAQKGAQPMWASFGTMGGALIMIYWPELSMDLRNPLSDTMERITLFLVFSI